MTRAHFIEMDEGSFEEQTQKMHSFIKEIIHYRNSREAGTAIDEVVIERIEEEYRDTLESINENGRRPCHPVNSNKRL